jgi:uncharacterized protein YycO
MKTKLFVFPPFLMLLVAFSCTPSDLQLRDGDIIFQTSLSSQSQAIQRATGSRWTHMGIILTHDGRQMVFEATDVVKFTPLNVWVKRGKGNACVVKRLKNADEVLTPFAMEKLQGLAARFEGRPYDAQFGWEDDRLYCSELVWKLYERAIGVEVGSLQKLADFHLEDTAVRTALQERYGDGIPLDEPVISPEQMFQSPLLETVYEQK